MAHNLFIGLKLNMVVAPEMPLHQLVDFVLDTIAAQPGFEFDYWALISEMRKDTGKRLYERRPLLDQSTVEELGAEAFQYGFSVKGTASGLTVQHMEHFGYDTPSEETFGRTEGWRLLDMNLEYKTQDDPQAACVAVLADQKRIIEAGLRDLSVIGADIRFLRVGYVGPEAPYAPSDALMTLVSPEDIAEAYADPDAYWAQWDEVKYLGNDRALVSRGFNILDEAQFKMMALERGLTLWRAAKPGKTEFEAAAPEPAEEALIDALPGYLEQVGYDPDEKLMEFTAFVPPDDHLSGKDILMLLEFLEFGTGAGEDVDKIRVVFPDEHMARKEAHILTDIGVQVTYFTTDGTWSDLAAEAQ